MCGILFFKNVSNFSYNFNACLDSDRLNLLTNKFKINEQY